ncbi:multi-sensor signal transduction multi-kinase [Anabaena cylindrica PCC 7122]|uniref:histidine kinase n=1 Tax=Anabaena cylindrica (strain ATCC 27899 / PCC 7122) TaxID=272123 RepID=K9ZQE2_ANACC|nr:multi-sensor signal transduction multi-kinase [Anabaena cylindrica PCC 7122]BAY02164.1 serine/threonine protein kinase with two-component sensor domain [Anabaena cylindrica PCC 7122]
MSNFVSISGYHLAEELYNGSRTLVYRAVRERDSLPVVIKLLKNYYPSFSELLLFRNQYTIGKNLNSPLIIQTYSLETFQNGYMLVMEDFGGISLKDYFSKNQRVPSLEEFLVLAIALCDTLDILYRERVIHKDIKPSNILINPETKQIKLIDFSIASLLPRETQTLVNPNVLEGTLTYISPEQTGRMNRGIDYRTDFYSLGITFYELLTNELPFQSDDAMELLYSHLAKIPPLIHEINPDIPSVISKIVSKLMAKNAEDRYQSALGLKFDLEKCLIQLKETGKIANLEIAQHDVCDRFIIPDKLYGREAEVSTLIEAFDRVSQGATEMILVAGFSGIGKTAVVNEVHKPIARQRGYFIKGKYDQFQRNIPFSAFVQAFRDLMEKLLTESDTQIQQWKYKILEAVGDNGQVIIEVIPELEKIIGEQPPAIELSGTANQNRFNLLFQKFTQVFTSIEHPLVIFLDDLQWADLASLKLIQLLIAETTYLFIIGAYRDNEVNPGHSLMLTLSEIQKTPAKISTINLLPLNQQKLNELVADTLKCTEKSAWNLSVLIYQKTQGNPFFATHLFKALHQDGLIHFDFGLRCWQCNIAEVKAQTVTDDVVVFMSSQLQKLPPSTQQVLQLAACIGNSFDLDTLAIVSERTVIETSDTLWKALQEGLILPISDFYKFYLGQETQELARKNQENVRYKFLHDRVQQAAYLLIPEDKKQETHYQIGQLLLHHISPEKQKENIFDIVNHLNIARELITTKPQRHQLAELNLMAGEKALAATAYSAAAKYFHNGIKSLDVDSWQSEYRLTLSLYECAIKAEYLNINFAHAQTLANFVLERATSLIDRVKVYEMQIQMYTAQSEMPKALDVGMLALELLGVDLNNAPASSVIHLPKLTSIESLPVMQDVHQIAIMRILMAIFPPAYTTKPELLSPIVLTMIDLSLKQGHTSLTAFAYVFYGILLCAFEKDLDKGYYSGLLALEVLDRFSARELECKVKNLFNVFIRPWKEPLIETIETLGKASQIGFEMGDIEYASYATAHRCTYLFLAGETLTDLQQEQNIALEVLQPIKQDHSLGNAQIWQQLVSNLLGDVDVAEARKLSGEYFDETELLSVYCTSNDHSLPFTAYLAKSILSYLFADYSIAVTSAIKAADYADAAIGVTVAIHNFYYSLALLSECIALQASENRCTSTINQKCQSLLEQVDINQKIMKVWVDHAHTNFEHKYSLVAAEKCRVLGQIAEAINLYEQTISLAKANKYIQEEALANELAAKFYLDWGKQRIAQEYMIEAYYAYVRWGAKAKVADLEKRYPQLLAPILQQTRGAFSTNETIFASGSVTSSSSLASTSTVSDTLDLKAILKASQTISGEIELEKLLSSLLSIIIENAGADKCVLMLLRDNHLLIKGSITQGTNPVVLQKILVEESQDIPHKLIYKVKHSQQTVVLLDATADTTLANDPYIIRQQPKSILCSPILHQGKLLGILYLENNLAKGVFTCDRVELLNLLCAQAAISLDNARLYEREQEKSQDLEQALHNLQQAQLQIIQSEKMSALGNLVAGVAHEMNNPLGFIAATLQQAQPTFADIIEHLKLYQETLPDKTEKILKHELEIDLDYTIEDLPKMLDSMTIACDRLKNISTSLRTFSRADRDYKVPFNIHEGIDSTILILKHRLKANEQRPAIEVITNYGNLPQIKCFPGQLNQVFMNILANGIDALDELSNERSVAEIKAHPNRITVTTSRENNLVQITITDNGKGMSDEIKPKIFDHLFTTKAVGKGTGLGLAIAKQIIEEIHYGKLYYHSVLGEGTEFIIKIPV